MERKAIIQYKKRFDDIRHEENGIEFWYARELMELLEYAQWRNFEKTIEKAKISCENNGIIVADHFADVSKMVEIGSKAQRKLDDYMLTRYACYLIAENGDPRKEQIAFAQSYFAVQTRKQELIEERIAYIERTEARGKLRESEKRLSQNIYERGVDDAGFARIRSKGDQALFGGFTTKEMKERLGVKDSRPLADFLPTLTIAAKNLATEMTNYNVEEKDLQGEAAITVEHVDNNSSVREMLGQRGIKPENLPPSEDIKNWNERFKRKISYLLKNRGNFMNRISLFKTRIVIEDKVYLLAKDVRKALGYKSIEQLHGEYPEIVKHVKDLPALVLESDFNTIVVSNIDAMKKLKHIEITRVETLRNNTEAMKSIYPLKLMVAGKMFEIEAVQAGYTSVNEYIEEVDFLKEINNEKDKLVSKRELIECIDRSRNRLSELIDMDVLHKNDLQIQHYIHIKECTPYLESFIVGQGIFFLVYDDGYAYDELRVEDNDLIIPTYDYDEDNPNKNYGHDPVMRDYREYSCLENILYIITHKDVEDAGVDLMSCNAPGISFYISQAEVIKLLNPVMK